MSEDDAQFGPDARERIEAALKAAPADWGVIQLRFDTRHFEPAGGRPGAIQIRRLPARLPRRLI